MFTFTLLTRSFANTQDDHCVVNYILQLEDLLKNALIKYDSRECGILFSGGVDSSLTAKIANLSGLSPTLLSLKTEKARDIEHIRKTAKFLKLPLVFVDVGFEDVEKELPEIRKILKDLGTEENLMQLSLGAGMYFLAKKTKELDLKICFCGQGSDELFAGYHKFKRTENKELRTKVREEFERLKRIDEIRDMGIFKEFGIKLCSPFLDEKVVKFAFSLPAELIRSKKENKIIVRKLAKKMGLPSFVYEKPKKALQY